MKPNFEALEKEYNERIQNQPDSYEANLGLANLYFDQAVHEAEVGAVASVAKQSEEVRRSNLAERSEQKYEQALPFFKKAVELIPTSALRRSRALLFAEAHLRIGEIYFLQESYVEAKKSYLKALEIESYNPEALNNLGVLLFTQGEYSEAEEKLKASIAARPDFFEALLNLGALYLRMNKIEQALQILEKASTLNPDSAELRELIDECHKSIPTTAPENQPTNIIRNSSDESKVTLYVPCYNAQQYIGACLEGILKQTYPIEEILVVDDGCTDGSMEIVSQYPRFSRSCGIPPVKIIQHEVNKGLAVARNTAIQNATGDFIASLDSDCVPEPDWLERLMENFTLFPPVLGGRGVENIAGVGGKLLEAHTTTVADLWRSVHLKQHWGDEKITNPDFLFGADNVYRKDALLKVGLYNEEYRTNYEDCDMFERLKKSGYTMVYEPKAIAHHQRIDDVCSVVNTFWNWNKHVFQKDGCFDNFERLTQKINLNTVLAARYLMEDITKRKSQILYPDLLISAYHTLLDLKFYHHKTKSLVSCEEERLRRMKQTKLNSSQSAKTSENQLEIIEQTFNALIILATWTAQQKSPDTELYKLIGEDLLTIRLNNPRTPPLSLEELLEELSAQTPDALDINKYSSLHEAYLNNFFLNFQQLFDKIDDPLIVKMIEVSAKAAHESYPDSSKCFASSELAASDHQEEGKEEFASSDAKRQNAEGIHQSPITNHQSRVKVLLANPPWQRGNRYGVRAGSRWPFTMSIGNGAFPGYIPFPFFLAYATSLLKKHGIDAIIVDAIAEGLTDEEFIHRVRGYKPDLILIESATASIDVDLNMAERLKADLSLRYAQGQASNEVKECDNDVYIALSGTHATVMKESLLKEHEYIDFILYGEYELTLLELTQCLQNGGNVEEVQGMTFRRDSEIIITPPRPLIENLDELPWPARLSLPMYNYNDQFAGMPYPNVQVMASRGCPFQCIFCVWPQILYGGTKYRTRSPKDVVDEIGWLIDYHGFEAFYFDDDTFNIGKKRILEICDEIKKRGINVPWAVMARADTSDHETLKAMADAGLFAIKFGVESGVQELVDNCGKKLDLSKVREAVEICKQLGIQTHLTFTFGLPGETKETIQKTIDFAIELDSDSAQFSLTTPFPGTKYFDMLDEKGLLCSKNWADYDGALSAVIQSENLTIEELEAALEEANRRWNEHLRGRGQVRISQPQKAEGKREELDTTRDDLRRELTDFYKNYKQYYVTNAYYQMARQSTGYPFFDYLVQHVDENMTVLDIGCASSVLTMEVSRFAKTAIGIDISPAATEFANKLKVIEYQRFKLIEETLQKDFQSEKIKDVQFIAANAEELPFESESLDLIFSTEVFEHIIEPYKALDEVKRVLKPEGQAVLNIPRPPKAEGGCEELRGTKQTNQRSEHIDVNLNIKEWEDNFINMPDKDAVSRIDASRLLQWCKDNEIEVLKDSLSEDNIFVHLRKGWEESTHFRPLKEQSHHKANLALRRSVRYAHRRLRLTGVGCHERPRIVFVCWVNHVRAFKQAYALSKHFADQYELILLVTPFVNVFSDLMEGVFEQIIFYNNVDELKRILPSLNPDLIHYHSQWSTTQLGVATIESVRFAQRLLREPPPCPVIMDVYDSVSLMRCHLDEVTPWEKDLMLCEKFCFENCDGVIYKGSEEEMRFYESTFGIEVENLQFMDYCAEDFCIDKKLSNSSFNGKDIHIVYAGGVNPITDDKDAFSNGQFLDVANFLASQKIDFHIYPNAFPSHKERYDEYISFDESCEYFHFHDPLPYGKLIKQISQYDYGWHVHTYTPNSRISRLKQQWTTGNKFFTHLEASIPTIVSKNLYTTYNLVVENQLGIGMAKEYSANLIEAADIVELKSQLAGIDREALQRNIENIRKNDLGFDKNVEILAKFYERILEKYRE